MLRKRVGFALLNQPAKYTKLNFGTEYKINVNRDQRVGVEVEITRDRNLILKIFT